MLNNYYLIITSFFSRESDFHELEAQSNTAFYENQDRPETRCKVCHTNTSFYFIKCIAILDRNHRYSRFRPFETPKRICYFTHNERK